MKPEARIARNGVLAAVAVLLVLSIVAIVPLAPARAAQSSELRAMVSDGLKTVVEELTPQIEKATGRKLVAQFNSSKNLRDKILAGEPFDAVAMTADVLDDLIKQGKVSSAGRTDISRTGIGLGVRAGASKPDIRTPDALKRTLLSVKSVGFNPTGASAVHTYDIFARLGIADAMKPKLMLDSEAGRPQMNVAAGKTELVISLVPEIQFFPGVELVGPVPADLQSYVNFAGGVGSDARDPDAAKAFLKFLVSPDVKSVLKSKGMEPR